MKARFKKPIRQPHQPKVHVLTGISVGTHSQTGEKFHLFVNLVNRHQKDISQLTIMLTGELHGYQVSLEKQIPLKKAIVLAKQYDQGWLKANKTHLNLIQVPVKIVHWHDLNNTPIFKQSFNRTQQEYQNNLIFKKIIDDIVKKFSAKLYEELKVKHPAINYQNCVDKNLYYCLEEASIYSALIQLGANLQVYPGKNNAAMDYIYQKYTQGDPLPWVEYRFD